MISGAHVLLYSNFPEADRAFLRDVLQFRWVDAGHGWLIFKLPPAEVAVHPADGGELRAELYFMCDDLAATMKALGERNIRCSVIEQVAWGMRTTIRLPSGSEIGLYQPTHPTAISL